jgi:ferredoxin
MTERATGRAAERAISRDGLQQLIEALAARGFAVIGPTIRDGAIVYDQIAGLADLPAGWTDVQEPGRYRLARRDDEALFGFAVGSQSWKRFLHPPVETLWRASQGQDGLVISPPAGETAPRYAFLGVRACELHAFAIQDRVFLGGAYADTAYASRRADVFFVAVNCGTAGGTCFCASMNTGPRAQAGFDLALTELVSEEGHQFVIETGSDAGADLLDEISHRPVTEREVAAAEAIIARTAGRMGRHLDTDGLKDLLQANLTHPRWDEVAARCLTCGNCTMVCPTCFCTSTEDVTDLTGEHAERWMHWASCFGLDFSYVHPDSVRQSGAGRYRHWITHKLGTWHDQFGTSGCVGCGRCIAWCPTGIDITAEMNKMAGDE